MVAFAARGPQCDHVPVLNQLAAVMVGPLLDTAVDRAISALFDANADVQAQLDRIESKIDAIKNLHSGVGWTYLNWAREPHRSPSDKKEQISLALEAFVSAAASGSDDPMSRSISRVYQAVCWSILGSPDDVRRRLLEAMTDAYDAVYQVAVQYNQPQRTAVDMRKSWVQRRLPGWEVTEPKARWQAETGNASALERFLKGNPTRPARRLQTRMESALLQVNVWALSVGQLYGRVADRAWLLAKGGPMTECMASASGQPGILARAKVVAGLRPGATIDLRGITISFIETASETVGDVEYVDVLVKVNIAGYAKQQRAPYRTHPWCILDQEPINRFGDDGRFHVEPVLKPGAADASVSRPWLRSDTSKWLPDNGVRIGPGFADEVSGWRRFRRHSNVNAMTLVPAGPLWPLVNPRDPRPHITVQLWLPSPGGIDLREISGSRNLARDPPGADGSAGHRH